MKARPAEWTVVLVGQWNPAVFNPEWIARHLNNGQPVTTEIATGAGGAGLAGWRLLVGDLVIVPGLDRVTLGVRAATDDALKAMEAAAATILELLPHTPLVALGVNFGFEEAEPTEELLRMFRGDDLVRLAARYEVVRHEIRRAIKTESEVINLRVALGDGAVTLAVNFHRDLSGTPPERRSLEARGALAGRVGAARRQALEMLSAGYSVQLEEGADEEP